MRETTIGTEPEDEDAWRRALERAIAQPAPVVFQPVVDMARGVIAGYETLARFSGPPHASPDRWFDMAARLGLDLQLEASVWRAALEAAPTRPSNTFLAINSGPVFLASDECRQVVEAAGSLEAIVIEVTEHSAIEDYDRLIAALEPMRRAGASLAVDDAGAGYASMRHVLLLRPQFVKLDAAFTSGCDNDPAKAALIRMVGTFAGELDAWLIAEGIETEAEIETISRLHVPLGQGYGLCRPGEGWPVLPLPVTRRLRRQEAAARRDEPLAVDILEQPPTTTLADMSGAGISNEGCLVVLNADGVPQAVGLNSAAGFRRIEQLTRVKPSTPVRDLLRRAMTRDDSRRFDPLVCVDDEGRYIGLIRLERLIEELAGRSSA